jgi:ubiquinone/menaquinone biosynthesis C-methylase UbiE
MTVHPDAMVGFSRAAAAYERSRPGYPEEMVAWLRRGLGISAGRVVVDLAAGTGKLTRALVPTGATLVAVDPVPDMLTVLRAATGGTVAAVVATAEALPLADRSVHAIVVAQAFHWFATEVALAEMCRVLRTAGTIALVWNTRRPSDPLQTAISALVERYRVDTPSHASGSWRRVVDRSPTVVVRDTHAVGHGVPTDIHGLVDRVLSISFIAVLSDDERRTVERRVRALEADVGPAPVLRYDCHGYLLRPR